MVWIQVTYLQVAFFFLIPAMVQSSHLFIGGFFNGMVLCGAPIML